ncbi:MAG: hypothetical protein SCH98_15055 [Deferrisomatales bacterium]|nr:hypothetical protein [Deferrisomatales bacterium]
MSDVRGVAWFEDWQALAARQCELIRKSGTLPLRAGIDPETFVGWCASRGLFPNSEGRPAFVKHVELEYRKTCKGTVLA